MLVEDPKKEKEEVSHSEPGEDPGAPQKELIPLSNLTDDIKYLQPHSVIPAYMPKRPMDKVVLYKNSLGARRLYVYDFQTNTWHYVALT